MDPLSAGVCGSSHGGACADWFAIVALFRRPFGLPIPHTGIVPNNKDRIGGALGRFITNNFLTASAMRKDWHGSTCWVRWAVGYRTGECEAAGGLFAALLPRVASSLPAQQLGESVGTLTPTGAGDNPGRAAGFGMLTIIWAQGEAQAILAQRSNSAKPGLAKTRTYLTRKISQQSSGWIRNGSTR